MAHDLYIDTGTEKAHMMYTGEVPWHGLGTALQKPATSAEAIKAAGLDYDVMKVPVFAGEGQKAIRVPDYDAVVPVDRWGSPDCPVFGVAWGGYKILQNRDAFRFFDSIVGQGAAVYHTAGALAKGARIWILAQLPGMLDVCSGEKIQKYILLSTGHDAKTAVRVLLTPVHVVCQNTLSMALETGDRVATAYHTFQMDEQLEAARMCLLAVVRGFSRMENNFNLMMRRKMDDACLKMYLSRVFPEPKSSGNKSLLTRCRLDREASRRLYYEGRGNETPGAKETLWAAYNGVTEYVDHYRSRGKGQRMGSVFFGRGLQIKNRAYGTALEMLN